MLIGVKIKLASANQKGDNTYMNNTKNKISSIFMMSDRLKDIQKGQVKIKQVAFEIQGSKDLIAAALKAVK